MYPPGLDNGLMPELSDFRLGSKVVDREGKASGTLVSVIVDEHGFDPRSIVVKDEVTLAGRLLSSEKFKTTDEVVMPIAVGDSATHEEVKLSISAAEVRKYPLYLTYRPQEKPRGKRCWRKASFSEADWAFPGLTRWQTRLIARSRLTAGRT